MLLMAVVLLQPWPSMQMIYRSHWLSWTGGLFGAIYIAVFLRRVNQETGLEWLVAATATFCSEHSPGPGGA
jgi:uncharacterized membrane protein YdcZ (DUF606 family)